MEYEALIKITDSINTALHPSDQATDLYKAGDIVVVRPKGWTWGRNEVKEFLIVNLGEMTEEEALALEEPVTIEYIEPEDIKNPLAEGAAAGRRSSAPEPDRKRSKIVARRRAQFDIQGALKRHAPEALTEENINRILDRNYEFQPLRSVLGIINKQYVSDKLKSKQMLDRVFRIKTDLEREKPERTSFMLNGIEIEQWPITSVRVPAVPIIVK